MCHAFAQVVNIYQCKIPKLQDYFDNKGYTVPTQSTLKFVIFPSLGTKFPWRQKGQRPLDKSIDRVTIKVLHSLNAQFKMRHKATEYTKLSFLNISSSSLYYYNISMKACSHWIIVSLEYTHKMHIYQWLSLNVNLSTPSHISPCRFFLPRGGLTILCPRCMFSVEYNWYYKLANSLALLFVIQCHLRTSTKLSCYTIMNFVHN
jgi:hypothetical protein